jgi:colanic acid/amylovoran biosynthesis glycosyltransferase
LSISEYTDRALTELGFGRDRLVRLPVGVDLETLPYRPPRPPATPLRLVTVGRLVEEKGHDVALRALATLRRHAKDLQPELSIVGEGPERARLERLAGELGVRRDVRLLGAKTRPEIVELLRRSDVFVLSSRAEVLPVCLMEAQAIGLPVVATDVGAVAEVLAPELRPYLVSSEDSDGLARELRRLVADSASWDVVAAAGRRYVVSRYDAEVLCDRLIGVYDEVIRARRGGADGSGAAVGPCV